MHVRTAHVVSGLSVPTSQGKMGEEMRERGRKRVRVRERLPSKKQMGGPHFIGTTIE